ncbi:Uncharacterised protein [uncultured archaeon]|nr:Uncharacterised protein [uncultured archaeon]
MSAKDKKYLFRKPIYFAGIAAIVLIFISFAANSLFVLFKSSFFSAIYSAVVFCASIIFLYGFYVIGDKYKSKLLKVLPIIGIVGIIVFSLGGVVFGPSLNSYFVGLNQTLADYNDTISSLNQSANISSTAIDQLSTEISNKIVEDVFPLLATFAVCFFIFVIYAILWGVALIKLNDKIKYVKVTGVLTVVGACTLIVGVGLFAFLVAFIFMIVILFDQSKKFEKF